MAANSDPQNSLKPARGSLGVIELVLSLTVMIGAVGVLLQGLRLSGDANPIRGMELALAARDFPEAERRALAILSQHPDSPRALLIAGQSAAMMKQPIRAIEYFRRIPHDGTLESFEGLIGLGERSLRLGFAEEAERALRAALDWFPNSRRANQLLAQLLANEGRNWEAIPFAQTSIRLGNHGVSDLLIAAGVDRLFMTDPGFLEICAAARPDDPLPQLGPIKKATYENRFEEGQDWLERVSKQFPQQAEVQVVLGRVLAERGTDEKFRAWHDRLPESTNSHPELWSIRGRWARNHGQFLAAIRCYGETLLRRPNDSEACFQLSQLLTRTGDSALAGTFAEYAQQISTLDLKLVDASNTASPSAAQPVVNSLESLGRYGEAAAWCRLIVDNWPEEVWARQGAVRLSGLMKQHGWTKRLKILSAIDWSKFPLPDLSQSADPKSTRSTEAVNTIVFSEVAHRSGIDFRYFNGANPDSGKTYMFEFSGGGIGVLDFDGDHWPDIYLTQGCEWPVSVSNRKHRDRLFRNLGNGQFRDVTEMCGIDEFTFSQGIAVGDFDNDGFADLYVANIGPNRLFHNQGDGTFVEVAVGGGAAGNQWTTSCVMADVNGDGLPDIYAVNYLGGDVFERECENENRPVQCGPTFFPAEQDRLYLNLGDGQFADVTNDAGIVVPDGKGLGVVAADLDGSGRLSLFVANDTTANFLFANETSPLGGPPRFSERGVLAGVACDEQGQAQASMGIAADDANGDGLIDLFVTNFYRESNVLYVQQPGQMFIDGTRSADLRDPSFLELGFGTQFLDADLDGWPDLFVANGHINDFSHKGMPYEMAPQLFRNIGNGRFSEIPGRSIGEYFTRKALGRSVATLDINRDGRTEIAVTHVDVPFALLSNESPRANSLRLRFAGTASARDAFGVIARVTAVDGRVWTKQLTAGNGFEASNERQLSFGFGDGVPAELHVRWPSGKTQLFRDLSKATEFLVVEEREFPVPLNGLD